jgi:hypothetical protein
MESRTEHTPMRSNDDLIGRPVADDLRTVQPGEGRELIAEHGHARAVLGTNFS